MQCGERSSLSSAQRPAAGALNVELASVAVCDVTKPVPGEAGAKCAAMNRAAAAAEQDRVFQQPRRRREHRDPDEDADGERFGNFVGRVGDPHQPSGDSFEPEENSFPPRQMMMAGKARTISQVFQREFFQPAWRGIV